MATSADVGVGIDVAKAQVDLAVEPTGATWTVPRSRGGLRRLPEQLQALRPTRIVLEASGGYERLVVASLAAAGLPVVRVNPRQTHDFARALGILAKTDRIDARRLARFAAEVRPPLRPQPLEGGAAAPDSRSPPAPVGHDARHRAAAAPPPGARGAGGQRRVAGPGDAPDPAGRPGSGGPRAGRARPAPAPATPRLSPSSQQPLRLPCVLISPTKPRPSPHLNARLSTDIEPGHRHPTATPTPASLPCPAINAGDACISCTACIATTHHRARPFSPRPQPARQRPQHEPTPAHPAPALAPPRLNPTPAPRPRR